MALSHKLITKCLCWSNMKGRLVYIPNEDKDVSHHCFIRKYLEYAGIEISAESCCTMICPRPVVKYE